MGCKHNSYKTPVAPNAKRIRRTEPPLFTRSTGGRSGRERLSFGRHQATSPNKQDRKRIQKRPQPGTRKEVRTQNRIENITNIPVTRWGKNNTNKTNLPVTLHSSLSFASPYFLHPLLPSTGTPPRRAPARQPAGANANCVGGPKTISGT